MRHALSFASYLALKLEAPLPLAPVRISPSVAKKYLMVTRPKGISRGLSPRGCTLTACALARSWPSPASVIRNVPRTLTAWFAGMFPHSRSGAWVTDTIPKPSASTIASSISTVDTNVRVKGRSPPAQSSFSSTARFISIGPLSSRVPVSGMGVEAGVFVAAALGISVEFGLGVRGVVTGEDGRPHATQNVASTASRQIIR